VRRGWHRESGRLGPIASQRRDAAEGRPGGDAPRLAQAAQLLGTGTAQEAEQWEWLAAHLEQSIEPQYRMLLLHRPIARPNEGEHGRRGRYVVEAARERLLRGRLGDSLRVVLSGHTHQHLDRREANVRHVWMPSTAFVLPDTMQARVGEKVVGVGVLDVAGSSARIDVLVPDGMARHLLTDLAVFAELARESAHGPAHEPAQRWSARRHAKGIGRGGQGIATRRHHCALICGLTTTYAISAARFSRM